MCHAPEQTFILRGLDAGAFYEIKDWDTEKVSRHSGANLLKQGLRVEPAKPKQAALLSCKRVTPRFAKVESQKHSMSSFGAKHQWLE